MEILKYLDEIQKILETAPYVTLILSLMAIIYFQHKGRKADGDFMRKMAEKSITIDDKSKENYITALAEVKLSIEELKDFQRELANKLDTIFYRK